MAKLEKFEIFILAVNLRRKKNLLELYKLAIFNPPHLCLMWKEIENFYIASVGMYIAFASLFQKLAIFNLMPLWLFWKRNRKLLYCLGDYLYRICVVISKVGDFQSSAILFFSETNLNETLTIVSIFAKKNIFSKM